MQMNVLPKTPLGKWTVGLTVVCIILLVLLVVLVGRLGTGIVEPGSIGSHILGWAFIISSITALITGLVSVIKSKERSILVFLLVVVMVFIAVFGLIMFIGEEFT